MQSQHTSPASKRRTPSLCFLWEKPILYGPWIISTHPRMVRHPAPGKIGSSIFGRRSGISSRKVTPIRAASAALKALSETGEIPEMRFLLGLALLEMEEVRASALELEKAVELDPSWAQAHEALGWARFRCCDFDAAKDEVARGARDRSHSRGFASLSRPFGRARRR